MAFDDFLFISSAILKPVEMLKRIVSLFGGRLESLSRALTA